MDSLHAKQAENKKIITLNLQRWENLPSLRIDSTCPAATCRQSLGTGGLPSTQLPCFFEGVNYLACTMHCKQLE